MQNYAAQDEILYHVGLSREMLKGAEYALLPGDPGRVEALAKALGPAQYLNTHREYTSWLAVVEGHNVLVCSTGMGGPSVAIGLEELARLGIKNFIRVGTTGCIQENINLGDVIINNAAVRLEGTSAHYAPLNFPAVASLKLTNALNDAAASLNVPHHVGIPPILSGRGRSGMTVLPAMYAMPCAERLKNGRRLARLIMKWKRRRCSLWHRLSGLMLLQSAALLPNARRVKALLRRKYTRWPPNGLVLLPKRHCKLC